MKKLFFLSVIIITTVFTSILYAAHNRISQEKHYTFLEQAYMAQYPVDMPPLVID